MELGALGAYTGRSSGRRITKKVQKGNATFQSQRDGIASSWRLEIGTRPAL